MTAASAPGWPRCEKCGGDDVQCRWHGEGAYDPSRRHAPCWGDYGRTGGKPAEEHLHYHCRRCQFDWTGPLTPEGPPNGEPVAGWDLVPS
jgi:hypothetical protein